MRHAEAMPLACMPRCQQGSAPLPGHHDGALLRVHQALVTFIFHPLPQVRMRRAGLTLAAELALQRAQYQLRTHA